MSLLPHATNANPTTSYFALAGDAGGAVETAQGFVATGGAEIGPAGTFSAQGDAVPGGLAMFNITRPNGAITWSMGLDGTPPSGTNVGNNLAIYSYDNSGAFIGAPLQIVRSTGGVVMNNGLTASQVISSGAMACESLTVDGSNVQISQTDFIQNFSAGPITTPIIAGISTDLVGSFTVPVTGLYLLSADAQIDIDAVNGCTVGPADSLSLNVDGDLNVCLKPYSMPNSASSGLDYQLTGCSVAKLIAATPYQMKITYLNVSGTMAFPGGLSVTMKLVPLCS